MGLWAELKSTINSTLGTNDFKPLDKIIQGQRTLAASDSVIQVFELASTSVNTTVTEFGRFVPKVNGSVRIVINYSGGAANSEIRLRVHKDGSEIFRISKDGAAQETLQGDFTISAGSEYSIQMHTASGNYTLQSVAVCANIVDTSLVEVL